MAVNGTDRVDRRRNGVGGGSDSVDRRKKINPQRTRINRKREAKISAINRASISLAIALLTTMTSLLPEVLTAIARYYIPKATSGAPE